MILEIAVMDARKKREKLGRFVMAESLFDHQENDLVKYVNRKII